MKASSEILEAAKCRTPVWRWMNMWRDLSEVETEHYRCSSASLSLEGVGNLLSGAISSWELWEIERGADREKKLWACIQVGCCRFSFCLVAACLYKLAEPWIHISSAVVSVTYLPLFEESRHSREVRRIQSDSSNPNHPDMCRLLIEWLFVFFED